MRLTLRTLLAYLDEVLEPEDAETLRAKIEGSRNAKTLVENIRQGLRRPQLSAPSLDGKGMGGNPNSVSEYLDNTLAIERIPELERNCLESEVLLVEVAACHHILTMAVGRSAEAGADLRNRIYALPKSPSNWVSESGKHKLIDLKAQKPDDRNESGKSEMELVGAQIVEDGDSFRMSEKHASAAATRPAATIRQKGLDLTETAGDNGVPAYLRMNKSSGWNQALITGALITVLLIVLWQAIGSMDRLKSLIAAKATPTATGRNANSTSDPVRAPKPNATSDVASKSGAGKGEDQDAAKAKNELINNQNSAVPSLDKEQDSSTKNTDGATPDADDSNKVMEPEDNANNITSPTEQVTPTNSEQVTKPVIDEVPPAPTVAANPKPSNGLNASVVIGGTWLPSDRAAAEAIVLAWEKPVASDQPVRIERLTPGVGMKLGSSVIVPPAYRTVFSLPPGIRLDVFGPMEMEFVRGVPKPAIRLHRGRIIFSSSPDCRDCDLEWGNQKLALNWESPASACAIELFQMFVPGTDGKVIQSSMQILPIEGSVSCELSSLGTDDGTEPTKKVVEQGEVFVIDSGTPPDIFKVTEMPAWIGGQAERPIDIAAATELASMVKSGLDGNPLEELRAMIGYRRIETAALAARTLSQFGIFNPMFGAKGLFNNSSARSHWELALADMRITLASHPELIGRLVQDIEATCGDRANRIKWLMLGPSNDQLVQGGDRELVDLLNSQLLDERVLASSFLRFITGQDFGYLAERPTPESLIAWRKFLSDKAIRLPQVAVPPPATVNP